MLAGAGKTHTISRLAPLVMDELFANLEAQASEEGMTVVEQSISASFVEIYNEHLTDLLNPAAGSEPAGGAAATPRHKGAWDDRRAHTGHDDGHHLPLRHDRAKGWFAEGALETPVASAAEAMAAFERGTAARRTAATSHNARSSRSHAIFTLSLETKMGAPNGAGVSAVRSAKLSLVDLAGAPPAAVVAVRTRATLLSTRFR